MGQMGGEDVLPEWQIGDQFHYSVVGEESSEYDDGWGQGSQWRYDEQRLY